MKRRDFFASLGGIPFLTITGKGNYKKVVGEDGIVETTEERIKYTKKLLNRLCLEIGPRPTGSTEYERGARIIKKEMERSLGVVNYDRYSFFRWELVDEPEFLMGRQQIETCPSFGGEGTAPDGITGILKRHDNGFELVDSSNGKTKALITVNQYGKAITHNDITMKSIFPDTKILNDLPSFGVGKQDVPLIEKAVQNGTPTRLKAWIRRTPNAPGFNIVGKLPGKSADEILFLAHADTMYNTPGAIDNTASVIIMLMLAHAAARNKPAHTLTFVATDAEELGMLGAKHYAKKRIAEGSMKNIRYVVNFDSLTWGPNLHITSKQNHIKELIRSIHQDLDIKAKPKFFDSDGFVMDSEPFRPSGAQAMYVNSRGYDEKTLPVYHRPSDVPSNVPLDCMEIGFKVFNEFIKRADEQL